MLIALNDATDLESSGFREFSLLGPSDVQSIFLAAEYSEERSKERNHAFHKS